MWTLRTSFDPQFFGNHLWRGELDLLLDAGPAVQNKRATAVEILDLENAIVLQTDLPGIKVDELDIEIHNNVLTLRAEAQPAGLPSDSPRTTRRRRPFLRRFTLTDDLQSDAISAELQDGVLTVTVPKQAQAPPRKIQVSRSSAAGEPKTQSDTA